MKARATAIVLAAGKGTRMKSDRPKVLFELCGRPMLVHVLEAVRAMNPEKIIVIVGWGKEKVQKALAGEKGLVFVDQGKNPRGTGHALQVSEKEWRNAKHLLVTCGDTPLVRGETLKHLVDCHIEHQIDGVSVLTGEAENPRGYGRILRDADGHVIAIREEADATEDERKIREINTGIYAFTVEPLRAALKTLKPENRQGELYLTDTVRALRTAGKKVHGHRGHYAQEVLGANSLFELSGLRKQMQWRILEKHMANGVEIVDPATTYIDAQVEIGPGTEILPCTVIRGRVKIGANCEVGPFTHLREGTVLADESEVGNFTELKKSRLGKGSKAKHLSYLGDAEIGAGVNIGAGTITANYDGKGKYETVIRDGAFIGSGTVLVAPATVGRRATTGAGAVVTRKSQIPDSKTWVGIPARPLVKGVSGKSAAAKGKSHGA